MPPGYDVGLYFKSATEDNRQLINTPGFPKALGTGFPPRITRTIELLRKSSSRSGRTTKRSRNGRPVETSAPIGGKRTWHWSQELPGVRWTIKNGVVFDNEVLVEDAVEMVAAKRNWTNPVEELFR